MSEQAEFGLVVSFYDQSPAYTYGFEAGMIWRRLECGEPEIEVTARVENIETIRRMAIAKGYDFADEPMPDGWHFVTLLLAAAPTKRANPRGLKIVQGGLSALQPKDKSDE